MTKSSMHVNAASRYFSSCDLRNLGLLRPALEGVSQEDLAVVDDALLLLRRSARTVDSGPPRTFPPASSPSVCYGQQPTSN